MPFTKRSQLPPGLSKLSLSRANRWARAYDELRGKRYPKDKAAKIAWYVLRRKKTRKKDEGLLAGEALLEILGSDTLLETWIENRVFGRVADLL